MSEASGSSGSSAPAPGVPAPPHRLVRHRLYLDAQHGLCNRLRAIASAAGIAARTDRALVVIWRPDPHCEARLGDLFRYSGAVIEDAAADDLRARSARVYNYMEIEPGARFEEPILAGGDQIDGDIYVRSAYPLVSPYHDRTAEHRFLRELVVSDPVRALVERPRPRPDIAVHIRMASGPGFEHLPYESTDNWPGHRHAELLEWRRASHADRFLARLETLLAEGCDRRIFVAADLEQTYARLAARLGHRVDRLERDRYDRSARQLQFAVADLMLLARAPFLLASGWSSFSDMAARLGGRGMRVERSGVDF